MVLSHAGLLMAARHEGLSLNPRYTLPTVHEHTKHRRKLRHSYKQQEATVINLTESGSINSNSQLLMPTKQNSPPTHASYKNPVRPSTQKQRTQSYTAGDSNV
jgi:hypothetical protein